ncbi:flotillin [Clostridia bacterium]|nr:flotillin [Clostridia bacterium]
MLEFLSAHPALLPIAIPVLAVLIFLMSGYVKAPPDEAYVISGLSKKARRLIGKAGFRIPILERLDKLILSALQVDVRTSSPVPTKDFINVTVDCNVNVKVPTVSVSADLSDGKGGIHTVTYLAEDLLARAQQNFLNRRSDYIAKVAKEVLEGNIREIVGQLDLREMVQDRQRFAELVKENAMPDLAELGLTIVSFNVQNFSDATQTIENLGIDNIERIRKDASIAKANAARDVSIAQSKADNEANDARVAAQLAIAQKDTDLAVRQADLQVVADTARAKGDAALAIEAENQRKLVEVARQDASIAAQEREIVLSEKQAENKEKQLDAEIRKQADAAKYKTIAEAEADKARRINEAEAVLQERTRQAEAEIIVAEAHRKAQEQEAIGIRAVGEAEGDAIRATTSSKAYVIQTGTKSLCSAFTSTATSTCGQSSASNAVTE